MGGPRRSAASAEQAASPRGARRRARRVCRWRGPHGASAHAPPDGRATWCRLARPRRPDARASTAAPRCCARMPRDDAADRVFRAIDAPAPAGGSTRRTACAWPRARAPHRRFDRAVPLLQARCRAPAQRDDLLFSIGRARFVAEDYATAERTYLGGGRHRRRGGARHLPVPRRPLRPSCGDDDRQPSGSSARDRAGATPAGTRRPAARPGAARGRPPKRPALCLVAPAAGAPAPARSASPRPRRISASSTRLGFPRKRGRPRSPTRRRAVVAGRHGAAGRELARGRPRPGASAAEADYWSARGLERAIPQRALDAHLRAAASRERVAVRALRAEAPSEAARRARAKERSAQLPPEAEAARRAGDLVPRAALLTDAALLAPPGAARGARRGCATSTARLPAYARPRTCSRFPSRSFRSRDPRAPATRTDVLLAMGLFDDATDGVAERYPLASPELALTRAEPPAPRRPRASLDPRRGSRSCRRCPTTSCRSCFPGCARASSTRALPDARSRRMRCASGPTRGWCWRSCARSPASTRGPARRRPRAGCCSSS